jgi:hypothetical protein
MAVPPGQSPRQAVPELRCPLANRCGLAHLLRARVHCQWEMTMKGQEKKKEEKKKPQKTLKEKRAEKHAKKESKG